MTQKMQKKFFICERIASKLASLKCPYEEQDTFHWQPMC